MLTKQDVDNMKSEKQIVSEIHMLREQILGVKTPERLFGQLEGKGLAKLSGLNHKYFEFVRQFKAWRELKEDIKPNGVEEAFEILSDLYREAQDKIRSSKYAEKIEISIPKTSQVLAVIEGGRFIYYLRELIAEGEVSNVYSAEYTDQDGEKRQACLKIAKDKSDNELLENEQNLLSELEHISLPKAIEGFEMGDGRMVSALSFVEGHSFYELRKTDVHKEGLSCPDYHLGWILERSLALLGYLHSKGIVHGAVEPAHLILNPKTHNVVLADLCWAIKNPGKKDHIKIAQEYYSAPEVYTKSQPDPKMDLYGLGKSVVYLLGGDPEFATIPDSVNVLYKNLLERMTEDGTEGRASDAYQLAHHLVIIRDDVSGKKRKFIPLPVENELKASNG